MKKLICEIYLSIKLVNIRNRFESLREFYEIIIRRVECG